MGDLESRGGGMKDLTTRLTKVIGDVEVRLYSWRGKKPKYDSSMSVAELLGRSVIKRIARAVVEEIKRMVK